MTFGASQPRAGRARRQAAGAWLGAALALAAAAEPPAKTAQQWLQAMDAAFRELDYDGVFSYYTATRSQPFAFAHASREADRERAPNGQDSLLRRERRAMGFGFGQRGAALSAEQRAPWASASASAARRGWRPSA